MLWQLPSDHVHACSNTHVGHGGTEAKQSADGFSWLRGMLPRLPLRSMLPSPTISVRTGSDFSHLRRRYVYAGLRRHLVPHSLSNGRMPVSTGSVLHHPSRAKPHGLRTR